MKKFVTATAAVAMFASASTLHAQRYELTGDRVAVYNLVGNLRVEAGTGSTVVVEVERAGRDASRLTIQSSAISGVQTLRVIYPGDNIVASELQRGSNTTIRVAADGTFNSSEGRRVRITTGEGDRDALHAHATIVVHLPQSIGFDGNLAVGTITATGTASALELESSAGDISSTGNRGNVAAETASGNITVENAQGDLELETASGDIEVNGATSQTIDAETASGNVRVTNTTAQDVELESASGNVRITGSRTPRLSAESASGDVRAELDGDVREVELSTASGSVEALLPANFAGEVELEAASGNVDVEFPLTTTTKRRNHIRGTIGTGGTARVSMESASGDVTLRRR